MTEYKFEILSHISITENTLNRKATMKNTFFPHLILFCLLSFCPLSPSLMVECLLVPYRQQNIIALHRRRIIEIWIMLERDITP